MSVIDSSANDWLNYCDTEVRSHQGHITDMQPLRHGNNDAVRFCVLWSEQTGLHAKNAHFNASTHSFL